MSIPTTITGLTLAQKVCVRRELAEVIGGSSFKSSLRCREFMNYVVERYLDGEVDRLTERFLGVELFGRSVDYETGTDSCVRVRATEVRKRLSQHYASQVPTSGVTITLSPGSYIPELQWHTSKTPHTETATTHPPPVSNPEWTLFRLLRQKAGQIALVLAISLLALSFLLFRHLTKKGPRASAVEMFWAPVLTSKKDVTICFGDTLSYWPSWDVLHALRDSDTTLGPLAHFRITKDDQTTAGNLRAMLGIVHLLDKRGINSRVRWPQEMMNSENAQTNNIFIGAFNNVWTETLNRDLRFSFASASTPNSSVIMIRDKQHKDQTLSVSTFYPDPIYKDYALITRIIDNDHKGMTLSIAGLNFFGTQAAGEFVTDEAALQTFARVAPLEWEDKNVQIVLEMDVSHGRAVQPHIVASNVW